jgi:nitrile hydratase accessory protein
VSRRRPKSGLPGDVSARERAAGREASARFVERLPADARVPIATGDPAFTAPWELRAFAIAVALTEAGCLDWRRFQAALIDEIATWEAQREASSEWSYYRSWLAALERVASHSAMIQPDRVDKRTSEILAVSKHAH